MFSHTVIDTREIFQFQHLLSVWNVQAIPKRQNQPLKVKRNMKVQAVSP